MDDKFRTISLPPRAERDHAEDLARLERQRAISSWIDTIVMLALVGTGIWMTGRMLWAMS